VFRVLQIVFRHHRIAGSKRVARHGGVFVGNVLGGAANLYVRAGAVIGARKRIAILASIVVTPATALILLS